MKHVETARILSFAVGAMVLAATGSAQARPDVRTMSCAQAQSLIENQGAIVLTTGEHTYERFISGATLCPMPDVPRLTYVQTSDEAQCPVGYTCVQRTDDDVFGR